MSSSKDPAGHIKISVSNAEKSKKFYRDLFENLAYTKIDDWSDGIAYMMPAGFGIWVMEAEVTQPGQDMFMVPLVFIICA